MEGRGTYGNASGGPDLACAPALRNEDNIPLIGDGTFILGAVRRAGDSAVAFAGYVYIIRTILGKIRARAIGVRGEDLVDEGVGKGLAGLGVEVL